MHAPPPTPQPLTEICPLLCAPRARGWSLPADSVMAQGSGDRRWWVTWVLEPGSIICCKRHLPSPLRPSTRTKEEDKQNPDQEQSSRATPAERNSIPELAGSAQGLDEAIGYCWEPLEKLLEAALNSSWVRPVFFNVFLSLAVQA